MNREFKLSLFKACTRLLMDKIRASEEAMQAAQESANHEEKSSAGDKYETGRAMSQLQRDMHAKQLVEAREQLRELLILENGLNTTLKTVQAGALIRCEQGWFFLASGIGNVKLEDTSVMVLSVRSPLAIALRDQKKGATIRFNQKEFRILELL